MKIRNIYRLGVVFLLFILFCFALGSVGRLQTNLLPEKNEELCSQTIGGLKLCTDTKKLSVTTGQNIVVNLVVKNVGEGTANVISTTGLSKYKLSIVDENGTVVLTRMETKLKYHLMTAADEEEYNSSIFVSHHSVVLQPNQSIKEKINLDKLYDLSNTGKYYVEIARKTVKPDGTVGEYLKLERIEVEVK